MNERRAFCRLEWLASMSEKTARARPFQALASMHKVFLSEQASWKAELLGQLLRSPAGKYDASSPIIVFGASYCDSGST
jgi:hypothetical protein